jgi:hypothetical protein
MDVLKTQGDIYRVKLIIAMPTIRSVVADWLSDTDSEFN